MTKFIRLPVAVAFAVLMLAACSRADMTVSPGVVSGCTDGRGSVVSVAWDARSTGAKNVRIVLTRPGSGERPWMQGPPAGQRKTGPWAVDGLTFVMRDMQGRELARRTVETSACPRERAHG